MKATLLIRKDHETMRELFERFRKLNGRVQSGKRAVFDEIRRLISVHGSIETEVFYPELRNTASERAEELVRSAEDDHKRIEQMLSDASKSNGNDKNFEAHVVKLIDTVNQHIDREEDEVFEEARRSLSEQRLEELGLEMEVRKKILNQIAA